MNNKRYPTRMHEILGVEPGEPFKIIGSQCIDDFCISIEGRLQYADNPCLACCRSDLEYAINNGITRRPRLTEANLYALEAMHRLFGYRWMMMSNGGMLIFSKKTERPIKNDEGWGIGVGRIENEIDMLKGLVSWSDPAPLDIVQTLRDAGRLEDKSLEAQIAIEVGNDDTLPGASDRQVKT